MVLILFTEHKGLTAVYIKYCIEMFVHVVGKGHASTWPSISQDLQESSSISAASHSQLTHPKIKMLGFSIGNPCPILLCVRVWFLFCHLHALCRRVKGETENFKPNMRKHIPQRQFEEFVKRSRTKFRKWTHSRGKDWGKEEEECLQCLWLMCVCF